MRKMTGKIMESTLSDEKDDGNSNSVWNGYMKSGIVINAIKDAKNTYQVDLINNQNTINVNKESDGFTADIYFDEYLLDNIYLLFYKDIYQVP